MQLPEKLKRVLQAVSRAGQPILVGGCVRDHLLGLTPHDFDIEVFGADFERLRSVLAGFGPTDVIGKSFGVVKVRLAGREYDFSLPRRETKTGGGHRDFRVEPDPGLTFAEAASRRDFTINAIGFNPVSGEFLDPHEGQKDLASRRLRHVGPAFTEDPLRVLRAFQLAARFDMILAPETAALCAKIRDTYTELPKERVWGEWEKWARLAVKPSRGLDVLVETDWLSHFPELARLAQTPQEPDWHPEGDVFRHTAHCLDALSETADWKAKTGDRRRDISFAVLTHDFGKSLTTRREEKQGRMRWTSPGHDRAGGPLAESFLEAIGAPRSTIEFVRPLVEAHMYHVHAQGNFTSSSVRRLARKIAPATIDDLCLIILADGAGRPPLSPAGLKEVSDIRRRARELKVESEAPRPILLGRHLIRMGLIPGPHFSEILNDLFEAQLEGVFDNEEAGLRCLRDYLAKRRGPGSAS